MEAYSEFLATQKEELGEFLVKHKALLEKDARELGLTLSDIKKHSDSVH